MTWRCNSRCAVKAEEHVGSEAERKVGNRHFIETIHQRGKIANRVEQGARSCQRVWSKDHAKPAAVVGQPVIDSADTVWNSSITKRMIGRAIKKDKGPRSLSGSSLLKKLFREALKNCNGKFHGVFLDIFSGDGGVSANTSKSAVFLLFLLIFVMIPVLMFWILLLLLSLLVGSKVNAFWVFGWLPLVPHGVEPDMVLSTQIGALFVRISSFMVSRI